MKTNTRSALRNLTAAEASLETAVFSIKQAISALHSEDDRTALTELLLDIATASDSARWTVRSAFASIEREDAVTEEDELRTRRNQEASDLSLHPA